MADPAEPTVTFASGPSGEPPGVEVGQIRRPDRSVLGSWDPADRGGRGSLRCGIYTPVRHATESALKQLDTLLKELRGVPGLREKNRGVFYRGSRAFLHFHEDPTGLFADVRFNGEFERMSVTTAEQRDDLMRRIREAI